MVDVHPGDHHIEWRAWLHPRDWRGRFIEKGDTVSLSGGLRGRVVGSRQNPISNSDPLLTVQLPDGRTGDIPASQVSIATRSDGVGVHPISIVPGPGERVFDQQAVDRAESLGGRAHSITQAALDQNEMARNLSGSPNSTPEIRQLSWQRAAAHHEAAAEAHRQAAQAYADAGEHRLARQHREENLLSLQRANHALREASPPAGLPDGGGDLHPIAPGGEPTVNPADPNDRHLLGQAAAETLVQALQAGKNVATLSETASPQDIRLYTMQALTLTDFAAETNRLAADAYQQAGQSDLARSHQHLKVQLDAQASALRDLVNHIDEITGGPGLPSAGEDPFAGGGLHPIISIDTVDRIWAKAQSTTFPEEAAALTKKAEELYRKLGVTPPKQGEWRKGSQEWQQARRSAEATARAQGRAHSGGGRGGARAGRPGGFGGGTGPGGAGSGGAAGGTVPTWLLNASRVLRYATLVSTLNSSRRAAMADVAARRNPSVDNWENARIRNGQAAMSNVWAMFTTPYPQNMGHLAAMLYHSGMARYDGVRATDLRAKQRRAFREAQKAQQVKLAHTPLGEAKANAPAATAAHAIRASEAAARVEQTVTPNGDAGAGGGAQSDLHNAIQAMQTHLAAAQAHSNAADAAAAAGNQEAAAYHDQFAGLHADAAHAWAQHANDLSAVGPDDQAALRGIGLGSKLNDGERWAAWTEWAANLAGRAFRLRNKVRKHTNIGDQPLDDAIRDLNVIQQKLRDIRKNPDIIDRRTQQGLVDDLTRVQQRIAELEHENGMFRRREPKILVGNDILLDNGYVIKRRQSPRTGRGVQGRTPSATPKSRRWFGVYRPSGTYVISAPSEQAAIDWAKNDQEQHNIEEQLNNLLRQKDPSVSVTSLGVDYLTRITDAADATKTSVFVHLPGGVSVELPRDAVETFIKIAAQKAHDSQRFRRAAARVVGVPNQSGGPDVGAEGTTHAIVPSQWDIAVGNSDLVRLAGSDDGLMQWLIDAQSREYSSAARTYYRLPSDDLRVQEAERAAKEYGLPWPPGAEDYQKAISGQFDDKFAGVAIPDPNVGPPSDVSPSAMRSAPGDTGDIRLITPGRDSTSIAMARDDRLRQRELSRRSQYSESVVQALLGEMQRALEPYGGEPSNEIPTEEIAISIANQAQNPADAVEFLRRELGFVPGQFLDRANPESYGSPDEMMQRGRDIAPEENFRLIQSSNNNRRATLRDMQTGREIEVLLPARLQKPRSEWTDADHGYFEEWAIGKMESGDAGDATYHGGETLPPSLQLNNGDETPDLVALANGPDPSAYRDALLNMAQGDASFDDYMMVAQELNDAGPDNASLSDLDTGDAQTAATKYNLPWPPGVGDFDRIIAGEIVPKENP